MAHIGLERLTGLIAFARAGSLGSYSEAARALGISPSAVSKSVQRLERQLGLSLFTRTTRSLMLTPEGRKLHERVMRLLQEADEIEQAALVARAEPFGTLKVTAPVPIGTQILSHALPRFRERYPHVTLDLRLSDRKVDVIDEGVDVAIRVGELDDSRLLSRRLAPHRLCAFAAPSYLELRGTPAHPDELAGHDCVNFRYQSSGRELVWPFLIAGRVVEMMPAAWITIDVGDAVLNVLAAGGGIGLAPPYLASAYVERHEVVPILSDFAIERSNVSVLWAKNRRNSPNVKAFLSFLTEIFPEVPPWERFFAERGSTTSESMAHGATR